MEEALGLCDSESAQSNPLYKRHFRAAAIKAFEFTYEISYSMIKRQLELLSSAENTGKMTFNDLIREAFGENLVRSDHIVWQEYRKRRGITSHTYNEDKAQKILEGIPNFLDEARYLLDRLRERNEFVD